MLHAQLRSSPSYVTAKAYFLDALGWEVEEKTFSFFSAEQFVCRVRTTRARERNEPEEVSFWLIYNCATQKFMTFSMDDMRSLKSAIEKTD